MVETSFQTIKESQQAVVNPILYKQRLALLLEEKKRRRREDGIKYYVPQAPPKYNDQLGFHKDTARIRAIFGGNRSGKTVPGAVEAIWYATGLHPYKNIPTPNYGRIEGEDFTNAIYKVILPEVYKWLPKKFFSHYDKESHTLHLTNRSTIEFMSYDQDIKKFESASRHWIWGDEEPPQAIYKANMMRLMDTKGDSWYTLTPLSGLTYMYTDVFEKSQTSSRISTYVFDTLKNPYIDKEEIDEIKSELSEAEIEARLGGKFVQMSGLIYREYSDHHQIKTFTLPSHWPRICSIDPHTRKPTVVNYMAVATVSQFVAECHKQDVALPPLPDREDIYILYDEIHPDPSKPAPLIREIAERMHAKEGRDHLRYRLIDDSANKADPINGVTIRSEFADHGIRTRLADKDVDNRIHAVRKKLKNNTLFIFTSQCPMTDWEFRHYAWDDYKNGAELRDPKETPKKKKDDSMDNVGYMIVSCPRYEAPEIYRPKRESTDRDTGY